MNGQVPSTLTHRRGIRASLLRALPQVWPKAPHTAEILVPALHIPHISKFDFGMSALLADKTFQAFTSPPTVQTLLSWEVVCGGSLVSAFGVRIYGVRYRSTNDSENDSLDDVQVPNPGGQLGIPGLGGTKRFSGSAHTKSSSGNRYSHLYALLYPPPEDFAAAHMPEFSKLHNYQRVGVEFLVNREHALLADDMGLGKTAQCSIAMHVLLRSERIRRALIICPRALVRQWEREAQHWASLIARPVEGTPLQRKRIWESFPGAIIATPQIVLNDIEVISKSHFDLVVCDDVSMLKNPGKITNAIRRIPRSRSWCLSGTPLEIKPEDFTNVMQFVKPDLFSGAERGSAPSHVQLKARVKPFFLRRRKIDCLKDLPPKQLIGPIELQMDGPQREAYRKAEAQQWQQLQALGAKVTKLHVLALMTLLLKLCNYDETSGRSAKADEIGDQLDILFDNTDTTVKAVVFSHRVDTLNFLQKQWSAYQPRIYHGGLSTLAREELLHWFKKGNGRLLLISTKAGRFGLNLQEASYVFHFDRTWNPVDEMQAEDRCWRMGQKRSVFVYRYLQVDTIEERVDESLRFKKGQFDTYVDSMAENTDALAVTKWSLDELIALMKPSDKK